jgi:hypothetical protein
LTGDIGGIEGPIRVGGAKETKDPAEANFTIRI